MSALGPLLSELVVQGVRQTAQQSLAKTAGTVIGNLASRGMLNGLKFSDPNLQATVAKYQSQLPQTAPAPTSQTPATPPSSGGSPTTVDEVVVTGARPPTPAPGTALATAFGTMGTPNLAGGDKSTPNGPPDDLSQPTDVGELVVTAPKPDPNPLTVVPPMVADGLVPTGQPEAPYTSDLEKTNIPPEALAAGLGLAGGAVGGAVGGGGGAAAEAAGNNGILGTGLDAKELIGAGLLGAGLLTSGSGGGGSNKEALGDLAKQSGELANRLGNIASAGFAGDIGGRGLNSIQRMVRRAQAAIRQRYAAMGMSGSTAEMQDLNAAAESGVDLQFEIGQKMASTGLTAIAALTGQSASIYTQLLNAQLQKNTALGNAVANFAAALVT